MLNNLFVLGKRYLAIPTTSAAPNPYNIIKLNRFAMELIRGDLSSSLDAALGNALLCDIKHLFQSHVDINEILKDKSKIDRAKSKVKVISEVRQLEGKTLAICGGIDSKTDEKTLDYKETEDDIENTI